MIHFARAGAADGVDRVADFATGDALEFLTSDGHAANAGFTVGKVAVGAGPQFVYDKMRTLYYDADGAGGAAAIKIALINGDLLTPAGISIVDDSGMVLF